ncbi:MAG: glycosyltransferase family 39 protein [Chloroflexi bacterium]|nr:glycosyltransferase family 39 protein [Chloroflexota bacterium]
MSGAVSVAGLPSTPEAHGRRVAHGSHVRAVGRVVAVGLAVFLLALAARLPALDAYVTIDESRWVQRASDFSALIGQHKYDDTFIIGHPGVTTMWTAYLGMGPERARAFSYLEGKDDATRRPGYFEALVAARRPFAVLGALGVMAVALLGWRLLGFGPALVGGLLLAFEPFLVAHARVVHLDSALTAYTATALLSALVFWTAGGGWPYLALSGLAAGLAFLTKAPSIYAIGFVPLIAAVTLLSRRERRGAAWLRALGWGVAWGVLALAVCLTLWPAFRVDPVGTLLRMAQFTERVGGGEHDNFFMGQVGDDPGPFFYPLALVLRLAPLTLVGGLLAGVLWRRLATNHRRTLLWLLAYSLGFLLMMSSAPKKFDRYLLPIFPLVGLAAGAGLWQAVGLVRPLTPLPLSRVRERGLGGEGPLRPGSETIVVLVLVGVLQVLPLLTTHPYPLAYYSPLLGGGAVAQRMVLVGWGEGLDRVAAWIDAQPRPLGEPTVATSYHRVLQAQLHGSAIPLDKLWMADYVVPYVNTLQRGMDADVLGPYLALGTPVYTVTLDGIEYARVYRGPHFPDGGAVGAGFGERVTLDAFVAAPGSGKVRPGEEIVALLRWDRPANQGERAAVAVVSRDGRVVVEDERPVGADGPNEYGQPGEIHRLTVPSGVAAGEYALTVRIVESGARTALTVTSGPHTGTDSVPLRALTVEAAR